MYSLPIILSALLSAFFLSVVTIRVVTPIAVKVGLVDKPGGHKLHEDHVPLVGGIAIYLSVFCAWLLIPITGLGTLNSVFVAAGGLLFVTGLIDDRIQLSVKFRFVAQIVAALLLIHSKVSLQDLGYLFSNELFVLGVFALPITLFAIVGAINSLNMLDGADGLAGLVSLVSIIMLALVAYLAGSDRQFLLCLCLVGSIGGFLAFNMRWFGRAKASIFMGDAGSTLLGFLIAYLLISLSQGEARAMTPVTALWIFAVPLMDTLGVALRRIWMRKSPFSPDRGHIHHLLLDAGFRVRHAVLLVAALQFLLGSIGVAGSYLGFPELSMLLAFLCVCGAYTFSILRPWRIVPRLRAIHQKAGLTVRGVRHVYIGGLSRDNAVAEVEALLGGDSHTYTFEIYQARSQGKQGRELSTYALVDAVKADRVQALASHLKHGLASLEIQEPIIIRQYIVRNTDNDRRDPQSCPKGAIRNERRFNISRLLYCSEKIDKQKQVDAFENAPAMPRFEESG